MMEALKQYEAENVADEKDKALLQADYSIRNYEAFMDKFLPLDWSGKSAAAYELCLQPESQGNPW